MSRQISCPLEELNGALQFIQKYMDLVILSMTHADAECYYAFFATEDRLKYTVARLISCYIELS